MLVISRKKNDGILIGEDIEITVVSIENNAVRLAINAPKEMNILRKELYTEVQNENLEASKINIEILKTFNKK